MAIASVSLPHVGTGKECHAISGPCVEARHDRPPFSVRALFVAVRPHQWLKNSLVLAAPVISGVIVHPAALLATLIATAAFCSASAATYLFNDLSDREADRLHPSKRLRPIAAGTLSVSNARTAAIAIGCLAVALAAGIGWIFTAVLMAYLVKTTLYSKCLKHIPIVDVATVSTGFVLRIMAGAVAVGVGVSPWLVGAVWAGAMFISLGKRHGEAARLGTGASSHRPVLDWYRPARTRVLMAVTQVAAMVSTSLWLARTFTVGVAIVATVAVFTILQRFRRLVTAGRVDDPVRVICHDRPIEATTIVLAVVMVAGLIL